MKVSSYPLLNGGGGGNLLQMQWTDTSENKQPFNTVVQNGNPQAIAYQGLIIDARNFNLPFTITLGPGANFQIPVLPTQYCQRQIPALPNMQVSIDFGNGAINNNGPTLTFVTYPVDNQDFTDLKGIGDQRYNQYLTTGQVFVSPTTFGVLRHLSAVLSITPGSSGYGTISVADNAGNEVFSWQCDFNIPPDGAGQNISLCNFTDINIPMLGFILSTYTLAGNPNISVSFNFVMA